MDKFDGVKDEELRTELNRREIARDIEAARQALQGTEGNGIILDPKTEFAYPGELRNFILYDAYGQEKGPATILSTVSVSSDSMIMGVPKSYQVNVRAFISGEVLVDIESEKIPVLEKTSDGWRLIVRRSTQ